MATWTKFYINTSDTEAVAEKIKLLAGIADSFIAPYPQEIVKRHLYDSKKGILKPDYLAVGKTQNDWVTIVHNSFDKMEGWAESISRELGTKVIVTIAQSVSSYYYFSLFERGNKIREIEDCESADDFERTNFGHRLSFEGPEPGEKFEFEGEEEYLFNFNSIEIYCQHFGLTIQTDYDIIDWIVIKSDKIKSAATNKTKWWQFWK